MQQRTGTRKKVCRLVMQIPHIGVEETSLTVSETEVGGEDEEHARLNWKSSVQFSNLSSPYSLCPTVVWKLYALIVLNRFIVLFRPTVSFNFSV